MSYEYNKVMNEMDIFFRGANWKNKKRRWRKKKKTAWRELSRKHSLFSAYGVYYSNMLHVYGLAAFKKIYMSNAILMTHHLLLIELTVIYISSPILRASVASLFR